MKIIIDKVVVKVNDDGIIGKLIDLRNRGYVQIGSGNGCIIYGLLKEV